MNKVRENIIFYILIVVNLVLIIFNLWSIGQLTFFLALFWQPKTNQIYQSPTLVDTHINLATKTNPKFDPEWLKIENNRDQINYKLKIRRIKLTVTLKCMPTKMVFSPTKWYFHQRSMKSKNFVKFMDGFEF